VPPPEHVEGGRRGPCARQIPTSSVKETFPAVRTWPRLEEAGPGRRKRPSASGSVPEMSPEDSTRSVGGENLRNFDIRLPGLRGNRPQAAPGVRGGQRDLGGARHPIGTASGTGRAPSTLVGSDGQRPSSPSRVREGVGGWDRPCRPRGRHARGTAGRSSRSRGASSTTASGSANLGRAPGAGYGYARG